MSKAEIIFSTSGFPLPASQPEKEKQSLWISFSHFWFSLFFILTFAKPKKQFNSSKSPKSSKTLSVLAIFFLFKSAVFPLSPGVFFIINNYTFQQKVQHCQTGPKYRIYRQQNCGQRKHAIHWRKSRQSGDMR